MSVSVIVVAGGRGRRVGGGVPKQFLSINGTPIIFFSLADFEEEPLIDEVIVVTLPEWISYIDKEIETRGYKKVKSIVEGGRRRQDSFKNGLDIISGDIVIDHDAVRPFPFTLNIKSMIEKCKRFGAVIPIVPVNDTIKYLKNERVERTVNREGLFLIQTPQVFKSDILRKAYKRVESVKVHLTDTASLLESAGIPIFTIPGSVFNIKITTKDDLKLASAIKTGVRVKRIKEKG
ncbi:2-C-methyl-D-erythritol 4-phosphate cytidylyltransferase [candidate division WOR-3 bacterium]|nr:2-C-methyl-D-erythritol 4-phosphate cytidylyltransferase [candidate division WOR-3 bacterium]